MDRERRPALPPRHRRRLPPGRQPRPRRAALHPRRRRPAGAAVVRRRGADVPRDRPAAARPARAATSTWPRSCTARSRSPCTAPLPTSGTATVRTTLTDVWDKGKAAVIWQEGVATSDVRRASCGPPARRSSSRGEGGWGGDRGTSEPVELPDRAPDADDDVRDHAAAGAALPALRRPQPAARRPRLRQGGRLPGADPARAVLLRHRAARAHRRRCSAATRPGSAASRSKFAGVVFPGETLRVRGWLRGRPDRRLGDRRRRAASATARRCSATSC